MWKLRLRDDTTCPQLDGSAPERERRCHHFTEVLSCDAVAGTTSWELKELDQAGIWDILSC